MARRCGLALPAASHYLRLLESRGLLEATRVSRWVKYRIGPGKANKELVQVLRTVLDRKAMPLTTVFRIITAFTHPRRIDICRALRAGPLTINQLQRTTGISIRALRRHISKLEKRRFIMCRRGVYSMAQLANPLQRELVRLARA